MTFPVSSIRSFRWLKFKSFRDSDMICLRKDGMMERRFQGFIRCLVVLRYGIPCRSCTWTRDSWLFKSGGRLTTGAYMKWRPQNPVERNGGHERRHLPSVVFCCVEGLDNYYMKKIEKDATDAYRRVRKADKSKLNLNPVDELYVVFWL